MARAKKTSTKPEAATVDQIPEVEQPASSLGEVVQDAVIVEEADQIGVPESETSASQADEPVVEPENKTDSADTSESASTAETASAPTPAPTPARSGAGFLTLLLGGACAAAIGLGVSQYLGNDSWPFSQRPSAVDALGTEVQSQAERIETLNSEIAALRDAAAGDGLAEIGAGLDETRQATKAVADRLDTIEQRLTDLENRPIPDVGATRDAVTAYQEQLAGMRTMFEDELTRIRTEQTQAAEQQQTAADRADAAMSRAALTQLNAAIDSGEPYGTVLDTLADGGIEIPDQLRASAAEGVPTLASLQRSYPPAAREALNASIRAQADGGQIDTLTAFLRTQLGTRSLEPKEGSDPDAVLSRAESALRNGDLAGAVTELNALPEAGAARMADWIAAAKMRQDAVAASAALSETLNN